MGRLVWMVSWLSRRIEAGKKVRDVRLSNVVVKEKNECVGVVADGSVSGHAWRARRTQRVWFGWDAGRVACAAIKVHKV
ncbi:hypothetical protein IWZ03DRAFT_381372 [Phyllosticta citriasiana]|uniref:Uncharacterized protein n=1 Tax=Phyllosticta citriasiana TaxID=595635 RepID=A0ABR1KLX0_9PEZI